VTQILSHEKFDTRKPTVLFVFGWTRASNAPTTLLITNAYLKRGDYNILLLDWGDYTVGMYSLVQARMCKISRIYGRVLLKLFDKGLSAKSFHCVGHSFGAHSCGIMGRELYQRSDKRHKFGRFEAFCVQVCTH
jgi:Lipase